MHERGLARARRHGAAELEEAMVGEQDVQQRLCAVRGEVGVRLDRLSDPEVAERDLALELASVGQLRAAAGHCVCLELADVVQKGARDREVSVDLRMFASGGGDHRPNSEAVVEQAVRVSVMVVLGCGDPAVAAARQRVAAEERFQQRA